MKKDKQFDEDSYKDLLSILDLTDSDLKGTDCCADKDSDLIKDMLKTYKYNFEQLAEHLDFSPMYIREITEGRRSINPELRKAIQEFKKHRPR